MKKFLTTLLFLTIIGFGYAQSLQHPVLYATSSERQQLLTKIDNNTWASSLVNSMKSNVDSKIATHNNNPSAIFSTVLTIPADDGNPESFASPYASAHGTVLSTAAYSAMLYYVTQDEKYARFSGDILAYYFDVLSTRTEAKTTITGNYFYDPRTCYNQLAVAYDFVYPYLKKSGTTVYNKASNSRVAYNHTKAQKVIRNIAARTLNEAGGLDTQGQVISNHPVLTAPGSIFPIMCIDDATERDRLFNLFWDRGTKRQNSFTKTILKMYTDQALWPESVSYGFMPNTLLVLNLVDKIKPGLNAGANYIKLFESAALLENLRLPNRYFVRYGDSHRKNDGTGNINRYALNFAKRRGYTALQKQAEISLKQSYPSSNGYSTSVPSKGFENFNALELFWGEPLPTTSVNAFEYKPTVIIEHAGVALQRNYSGVDDKENGLVGIIGGANYVHAHVTGITMELYGAGDVMAPNGGLPPSLAERSTMPFQGYFNRYAGNNTVIVNGTSKGSDKRGTWGANKELYQDLTVNIASEPKHLENPISPNFSFATQFLDDNVNNCDQQRTLSTIRTSATTAYYLDIFRSKSVGANNFHDYIYHNIGDDTRLINANNNQVITVTNTNRYQNDVGDEYQSPGWRTFEQTKSTPATLQPIKVRFDLNTTNRYMHMLLPGGVRREYTKAVGPGTYEALNGYEDKKTQIIAIRQDGEAWNKPYVSIFEPSKNANGSVQSVENLTTGSKIVGAKVVSVVGGKTITDYIISNENASDTYTSTNPAITFKGRFAVVRVEDTQTTLYIGEGTSLVYESNTLTADAKKRGLKVISGNQAPTVAITSPADNAVYEVGQEILFTATASDADGNLDRINFKVNNAYYVGDASAPYETTFTPTEVGTYKLAARAIDTDNEYTEVFVTVTVVEKNVAPIASFTTPTVSTIEEGYPELVVTVDATDPNGDVITVVLKIDGQEIRSESVAPYEWGHEGSPNPEETVGLSVGEHVFEAIVTDAKGLLTTISKTITITEKNIAPTASFTTPTESTLEEGYSELLITVDATDPNGDDITVVLKIDGQEVRSESVAPYEWGHAGSPNPSETLGLLVGNHTLEAIVTDAKGLSTTISKTIRVDNVTGASFLMDKKELTVFPNPSQSGLFKLNIQTDWKVFNIQGTIINSGESTLIDLSNKAKGMYFLKIKGEVWQLIIQ